MLEIKNGTLRGVTHAEMYTDINFVIEEGEMFCIYGWKANARKALLYTLLALQPLKSGFLSTDGDVVDERSAAYYRAHTAYVPREVDLSLKTVGDVMQALMTIDDDLTKGNIESEWRKVGIADGLWNALVEHVGQDILQQMMMVVAVMRGCNHMIIDLLPGAMTPEMMGYLRQYTASGGLIVIATDDEEVRGQCDKSLLEL
mgnify:CR=1 FL=1